MRRKLLGLALVFFLGSCSGAKLTDTETRVDFVEVPHTKIVYEKSDPVEVPVLPDICQAALTYAYDLQIASEGIYKLTDEQLDVISEARVALASGGDLNASENDQRALQSEAMTSLIELEEAYDSFNTFYNKCEEATK